MDGGDAFILRIEIESKRVRRPGKGSHPAVKTSGKILFFPRLAVVQHQPPAVALVSRTLLGAIGDVVAIPRIERSIVGGLVLGRDVLRRRKNVLRGRIRWKIHRDGEQIVVGGNRRLGIVVRGITNLLPVGRESIVILTAQGKYGRIVIPGSEIAGLDGRARDLPAWFGRGFDRPLARRWRRLR